MYKKTLEWQRTLLIALFPLLPSVLFAYGSYRAAFGVLETRQVHQEKQVDELKVEIKGVRSEMVLLREALSALRAQIEKGGR